MVNLLAMLVVCLEAIAKGAWVSDARIVHPGCGTVCDLRHSE